MEGSWSDRISLRTPRREMGLIASRSSNTDVSLLLLLIQVEMVAVLLFVVVCLYPNNALPHQE